MKQVRRPRRAGQDPSPLSQLVRELTTPWTFDGCRQPNPAPPAPHAGPLRDYDMHLWAVKGGIYAGKRGGW